MDDKHFYIRYDKRNYLILTHKIDKNKYYVKDIGIGSGTFVNVPTKQYSV